MSDTASSAPRVPKRVAAVILNSLKGGVVPRIGLPYITVGREVEIRALLTDLDLIAEGQIGAIKPRPSSLMPSCKIFPVETTSSCGYTCS